MHVIWMSAHSRAHSRAPHDHLSTTPSSTPQWTAEADEVYADYGIGDDDLTNDLAIDEKFWERLYEALGLTW